MKEEEIKELLEAAKPQIVESFKQRVLESADYELRTAVIEEVKSHVIEWVKAEVLPEVQKELVESKDSFISLGVKVAPAMMDELTKAMTTELADKLNDSWKRRKIFEALLQ